MHPFPDIEPAMVDRARGIAGRMRASWIGEDFDGDGGAPLTPIHEPYGGEIIAEVAFGGPDEIDRAVAAAGAALHGPWRSMGSEGRAALLRALAAAIEERRMEFALLETLDVGKPIRHSFNDDVPTTIGVVRWYASLIETAYDLASPGRPGIFGTVVREPQGVVGIVLPWNYPLTTLALKIGPALAAGNTVVCKPADHTPLSTLRLAELAIETGFPSGVINVVPGTGPIAGRALGLHPAVALVNFTGSTATGRRFLKYAADSNLKEIALECGGKNPAIVLPEVDDFDRYAAEIATGFLMNSGQLCSSISRLIAPSRLEDSLRSALAKEMRDWPAGNPLDPRTRIGPLASDAHAAKVGEAIDGEKRRNNDLALSGAAVTGESPRLVPPVVFYNVAEDSPAWRDEIFGPVLSVRFYDSLDDAVRMANDTDYGLSAYVFGDDPKAISRLSSELNAGFVAVNAFTEGDFTTPFGGFRTSGFGGKDKGIHSLDQYARIKSVWWAA